MRKLLVMLAFVAIAMTACQWESMKKENKSTSDSTEMVSDSVETIMDSVSVDSVN
jgi:hypothetical protein